MRTTRTTRRQGNDAAAKIFEIGGYVAAAMLVAFGIAADPARDENGRNQVRSDVKREFIVGSPDMNKTAILAEAKQARAPRGDHGRPADLQRRRHGDRHRRAGEVLRLVHADPLVRGDGRQDVRTDGPLPDRGEEGPSDPKLAAIDPTTKQPVENGARNLWVTETALTNALNTSFFAEQVAMFGIVVGIALVLSGFGFGILAFAAFRWLPAQEKKKALKTAARPVVA